MLNINNQGNIVSPNGATLLYGSQIIDENNVSIADENMVLGPYEILIVDEDDDDIPQSDWNQNDSTALDYIKNRTHWHEGYYTTYSGNLILTQNEANSYTSQEFATQSLILPFEDLSITYNGETFTVLTIPFGTDAVLTNELILIGDVGLMFGQPTGNYPFFIVCANAGDISACVLMTSSPPADTNIIINQLNGQRPIAENYIPPSIPRYQYSNDDLVAGESFLYSGNLYFVYE